MASNRQCCSYHENGSSRKRQNRKGSQGMHAGVCERVHLVHHKRGLRKVPTGEAQNGQRRGYSLRHDLTGLRKLLGSSEDLSLQIPRNPPRKSEQATHWAVCSRVRRPQCRRPREPTACTERRLRNGRRFDRLWISSPQRKWRRVLVAPSSGDPKEPREKDSHENAWRNESNYRGRAWRRNDYQERTCHRLNDHQNIVGLRRANEELGVRMLLLVSDCSKCASIPPSQNICLEVMVCGNRVHVVLTTSHLEMLLWILYGRVGKRRVHAEDLGILSSYLLDYYWSRFYPLLTRANQHSLCLEIIHVQKKKKRFFLSELQSVEF